jgi:hypothetical protein
LLWRCPEVYPPVEGEIILVEWKGKTTGIFCYLRIRDKEDIKNIKRWCKIDEKTFMEKADDVLPDFE